MSAVATYMRLTRKRRYATADAAARRLTESKGPSKPPTKLARRCKVTRESVNGFDVYTVCPLRIGTAADDPATVIYLHGGAYVSEIQPQHWKLIAELTTQLGCAVVVPIYGLAPQYHVDEALDLVRSVLGTATAAGPTYLVGDSAGGGLALAATLLWMSFDGPRVQGLTLIAPWLDVSLSNTGIADIESSDPWLSRVGLAVCGESWSGTVASDDPRVSPIFGDLDDVPPIDLYVGDRDITVADCRTLRDRLPASRLRYHEQAGAVHVYPLLTVPEGRVARRELIAHIRATLRMPDE